MKRLLLGFLASALLASAQDNQVRGKQLIDDMLKALGGEKFLKIQNRVETGRAFSFYNSQISGLSPSKFYTRYIPEEKPGAKLAQQEHQSFGKNEIYFAVLREEGGWEVTFRGSKPLEKDQIRRHHDSVVNNIFYILRNRLQEPGLIFEARGTDVIDNMTVNMVDVIDSENHVVTVYIHQSTKLPVRQDWVWHDAQTRDRNVEVTRFSRYRDVAGTQWPFQMHRERNGEKTYEMFADSVVINQNLDGELFAIPDANSRPKKYQ